jgi:hypothetical protein
MQRYRRDMTMLMTHNTVQAELAAGTYGRLHFQGTFEVGKQTDPVQVTAV